MSEFRLSRRAESQLEDIYVQGVDMFGVYQAEAYHAGLMRTFGLIADFPYMGAPAELFAPGLRRLRFQVHYVYYVVETEWVLIKAILLQRMDVRPDRIE